MITYRHLTTMKEFEDAVVVQREVWGFADVEVVPSRIFLISAHVGGQMIGAFDGGRLIGYCYAIPGIKKTGGERYLHSHMLGVLPDYRNRGIGRQLKLEQRADALARHIRLIEWTFDPLELKNAYLNIEKLAVIVTRYVRNAYGYTTSKLHAGLPTDRCVAEWRLDAPRTVAIINGTERPVDPPVEARIPVPVAIDQIRRDDIREARQIQQNVSDKFEQCFDAGLTVTGFERSKEFGTYLLSGGL